MTIFFMFKKQRHARYKKDPNQIYRDENCNVQRKIHWIELMTDQTLQNKKLVSLKTQQQKPPKIKYREKRKEKETKGKWKGKGDGNEGKGKGKRKEKQKEGTSINVG